SFPHGPKELVILFPRTVGQLGRGAGPSCAEGRMSGGQPRQGHPERRARHVVEADLVAEVDRGRVAAVLAADPELERLPGGAAPLAGPADQLADARLVEGLERVGRDEL